MHVLWHPEYYEIYSVLLCTTIVRTLLSRVRVGKHDEGGNTSALGVPDWMFSREPLKTKGQRFPP